MSAGQMLQDAVQRYLMERRLLGFQLKVPATELMRFARFADTRGRAQTLVPELEARLGDLNAELDVPVTVNINGCPNSCARIQVADIGFKGQMVDDGNGPEEGFQVHLGGSLGLDSGFGRKLRQHKVLATELGDYIERIVRNFVKQREGGERFAQWAVRADEDDLR